MMKIKSIIIILSLLWFCSFNQTTTTHQLPPGFVYLNKIDSTIHLDLKYLGSDNFVGATVDGYENRVCICTEEAATALVGVQKAARTRGWSLIVFDAYRPQKAVNHFIKWAQNINDTLTKSKFYPNVDKKNLFQLNYIASKSSHSRGSTFDVSLIDSTGKQIDMGTPFDYFGPESWPSYEGITKEQKENRMYLQSIMLQQGFDFYQEEWWHFTLKEEPFPKTYFDFNIK